MGRVGLYSARARGAGDFFRAPAPLGRILAPCLERPREIILALIVRAKKTVYKQKNTPATVLKEAEINGSSIYTLPGFFRTGANEPSICVRTDVFDAAHSLPRESLDLIITSPPYWGLRTYGLQHNWEIDREWKSLGHSIEEQPGYDWYRSHGGVLGLEPTPEWFIAHLADIFSRLEHALKPRGSMWVNLGDTYFARWSSIRPDGRQGLGKDVRFRRRTPMGGARQEKNLLLIPSRFAMAMQERRWILRNDLIWFKPNIPPRFEGDRLRLAHEHFFHFVKRPKSGRAEYYYDTSEVEHGALDVVTCTVKPGIGGHSATFPPEIIRPRIRSSCPPGGVVLDPFCGTGRALVEAVNSGRRAVGFEVSSQFHAVATQALESTANPLELCLTP
jgi:site-specific DNA-methyltransferase (cytosine-N4-specific)